METKNNHFSNIFTDLAPRQRKTVGMTLMILGIVIFALIFFKAGMIVGFKKAAYADRFGERYFQMFEGNNTGMMQKGVMRENMFPGGHGVAGKVVKIELPNIIVESPDNIEKVIVTDKNTLVRRFKDEIKIEEIKQGDMIVILGAPDDKGQVVARLIRIIPNLQKP